jgi:hypothetical protein
MWQNQSWRNETWSKEKKNKLSWLPSQIAPQKKDVKAIAKVRIDK